MALVFAALRGEECTLSAGARTAVLFCRYEAYYKELKDSRHNSRNPEANVAAAAAWRTAVGCAVECSTRLQQGLAYACAAADSGVTVGPVKLTMPVNRKNPDALIALGTRPYAAGFMCDREELQRAVWQTHPAVSGVWFAWEGSVKAENAARKAAAEAVGGTVEELTYNNPVQAAVEWVKTAPGVTQQQRQVIKEILEIAEVRRYHLCRVGQRYLRSQAYEEGMSTMHCGVFKKVRGTAACALRITATSEARCRLAVAVHA